LSGTTPVSRYQKGKTNLDFTEARNSEWQWHQLGHMQICTYPTAQFFTGRMPFLPPNQQCQSTEGTSFGYILDNEGGVGNTILENSSAFCGILSNLNVPVAISMGLQAVKLCSNKNYSVFI